MIGSFVTRSLALILGYAYPAYECFKTVELNKPDIEQLLFWCQYWILVAVLTVFERVGDNFISWLPMYGEAKLAFFVYLWCPKTKGTAYVYETFFRPYVSKHENEIDRNLLELRTRAGDFAILYFQKVASYGQTRFFEILQYVTSQSPSQPSGSRPVQPPQKVPSAKQQPPQQIRRTISTSSAARELAEQVKQPIGGPSSPTRSQQQPKEPVKAAGGPSSEISSSSTTQPSSTEPPQTIAEKEVQVAAGNGTDKEAPKEEDPNAPSVEETAATPIEEAIRVTRARHRKRAATAGPSAR